jgi:4-amino-4-deoxy-L-arabinose transferase-like glycosyltransferase
VVLTGVRSLQRSTRAVPALAWALVAVALVLRVGYVAATPAYHPEHDARDYDRLACALVTGNGYPRASARGGPGDECRRTAGPTRPTAFRPPGYPMFLAAVYSAARPLGLDRWVAARVVQATVGAAIAALIGLIAALLWGRRTGLIALGLAAVSPPLILFGGALMTEPLVITLMLGAIAAMLAYRADRRWAWLAVAAVLTGLAALTRSNAFLLVFPLAAAVLFAGAGLPRRVRAGRAAAFVGIAALVVAPWTVRNAFAFHAVVPVSTEAGSAFIGTYNDSARTRPDFPGAWMPPRYVPSLRGKIDPGSGDEPAEERRELRAALRYMGRHPTYVGNVLAVDSMRLLGLGGREWWRFTASTVSLGPRRADLAAYAFFPVLALALIGAFQPAARRAPLWFWSIPVLLWLSVVPILGETRFRMPIEPFFLLLAALALSRAFAWRPRSRRGIHSTP